MRLLSWNIQRGGGDRADRIIRALVSHDPDVIALSEFRPRPGLPICSTLASLGWRYIESTNPVNRGNGLCVFSRTPMLRVRPCPAPPENVARWLDVDFPQHEFGICVLHIPCSPPREPKRCFWDAVLRTADERRHEPFLFAGDFNTGARGIDETGRTFACAEHFAELSSSGWTDAWRHFNPGKMERTWYSRLKRGARGNGFRLDHAFASPSLLPRVTSCCYSHAEREAKVSDHSILVVEVG